MMSPMKRNTMLAFALAGFSHLPAADLAVNPSTRYQTIRGFGGGMVYYQNWLTAHPQKQAIFDTLFTGLGISYLRIGNWNTDTTANLLDDSAIVAEAKKRLGPRLHILMSSWSPPGYLKVSGQTAGSKNGVQLPPKENTLKKINGQYVYDQYAHWWLRSVQKYVAKGMRPDEISIQNEPDMNADYDGMILAPTQNDSIAGYAQALKAVSDSLAKMANRPGIFGPEVLGIGNRNIYATWEENFAMYTRRLDASLLSGYNYHIYDGGGYANPDGFIPWMRDSIANKFTGKPIVMSEYCNLNGTTGSAPDMLSGARILMNGLNYGNLSGYIYWDLIWGDAGNMVNVNNPWNSGTWKTPNGFQVNPEYHGMRHFSKFVAPGWSRVAASSNDGNTKVAAFSNPAKDSLTVIAINISSVATTFNAAPSGYAPVQAWQSQVNGPMSAKLPLTSSQTAFSLPASSITTLVFKGAGTSCTPAAIVPRVQINGAWQITSSVTVDPGATVVFGPEPLDGSWSWSGPNGFSASSREITLSPVSSTQAGNYVATYTSPSGCKSAQSFALTVNGTLASGTLLIRAKGGCGSEQMQLLINDNPVKTWDNVGKSLADFPYSYANLAVSNDVKVRFTNDATVRKCDRNLFVDYIKIGETVLQAEIQPTNTGVWTGAACGGQPSEWLNCGGYIDFANTNFGAGTGGSAQAVDIHQPGISASLPKEFTVSQTAQGLLLNLQGFGGSPEVRIFNLNGTSVFDHPVSAGSLAIPNIGKGIYLIDIKQDATRLNKKVLVK
jgi:O-glycosyl hydrolase